MDPGTGGKSGALKHRLAESCPPSCPVLAIVQPLLWGPFTSPRRFRFLFLLNKRFTRSAKCILVMVLGTAPRKLTTSSW